MDPFVPVYGKIDLTGAAKFSLRIAAPLGTIQAGIEPRPQLQKVVDPEGGAAGRGQRKGIRRHEIGQMGGQRQQVAVGVVVEDAIFTPVEAASEEDVFGTSKGMKRMRDPEAGCAIAYMRCSR